MVSTSGPRRLITDHQPDDEGGGAAIMATATKTKLRPLHDRILVKRVEEEEVRRGGIIIPDTAKEKPQEGKVIAVGTGKVTEEGKKLPLDVKAGDRILFGKYSGSEVKIDDEEYLILREEDVLGILD
jgi:chaperonin GroES